MFFGGKDKCGYHPPYFSQSVSTGKREADPRHHSKNNPHTKATRPQPMQSICTDFHEKHAGSRPSSAAGNEGLAEYPILSSSGVGVPSKHYYTNVILYLILPYDVSY